MHHTSAIVRRIIALMLLAASAQAETSGVSPGGFVSSFRAEVSATPQQAWQAIVQLPRWWSSQHTWSGNASNMSLDLNAGGCWCERWGEGQSAQHGQVVRVQPGAVVRLDASLGPLQELAVNGVLTIGTGTQDDKTVLHMRYRVSGGTDAGLDKLAPIVDRVLSAQFLRLKSLLETGKSEP